MWCALRLFHLVFVFRSPVRYDLAQVENRTASRREEGCATVSWFLSSIGLTLPFAALPTLAKALIGKGGATSSLAEGKSPAKDEEKKKKKVTTRFLVDVGVSCVGVSVCARGAVCVCVCVVRAVFPRAFFMCAEGKWRPEAPGGDQAQRIQTFLRPRRPAASSMCAWVCLYVAASATMLLCPLFGIATHSVFSSRRQVAFEGAHRKVLWKVTSFEKLDFHHYLPIFVDGYA